MFLKKNTFQPEQQLFFVSFLIILIHPPFVSFWHQRNKFDLIKLWHINFLSNHLGTNGDATYTHVKWKDSSDEPLPVCIWRPNCLEVSSIIVSPVVVAQQLIVLILPTQPTRPEKWIPLNRKQWRVIYFHLKLWLRHWLTGTGAAAIIHSTS